MYLISEGSPFRAYYQWINVVIYSVLNVWRLDWQCHNEISVSVLQSCPLPSPLPPRCPLLPRGSGLFLLECCSLPTAPVQRRLILTHAAHWTPPLFLHKVIAVRECALQRVARAPQAQRVRLGNKRAKSVLLRHSQILGLSLCCRGWGLTVMNIGQKLVFHMMIFPNENWWMREGGTRDCVMRGGDHSLKASYAKLGAFKVGRAAWLSSATPAVLQNNISWYQRSIPPRAEECQIRYIQKRNKNQYGNSSRCRNSI